MLHTQYRLSLVRPYKMPFIGWDFVIISRKSDSGHYRKSRGLRDDQWPVLTCWAMIEHYTQTCWAIFLVRTTAGKYRWEAEVLTLVCLLPCYLHQRGSWHKEWRYRQNSPHSIAYEVSNSSGRIHNKMASEIWSRDIATERRKQLYGEIFKLIFTTTINIIDICSMNILYSQIYSIVQTNLKYCIPF